MNATGRVMSDWQLDLNYETYTAEELRKSMYTEDDFPRTDISSWLGTADTLIGQAIQAMIVAARMADPFDKAGPIDELTQKLEDFRIDMNKYRRDVEGGKQ